MIDYLIFGVLQLFLGIAFTFYPPKKINTMYGYWGKSAKKSPTAWTQAHKTLGPLFIICGVLAMVIGYVLFGSELPYSRSISLFSSFGLGAFAILLTERKLKKLNS